MFEPHPLIVGGQLQTIFAYVYTGARPLQQDESLVLPVSQGDQLQLVVNHPRVPRKGDPIVYLLHGLGGSSESAYKLRIAAKLLISGFHTVRHNHRGCGDAGERAKGIYHSGSIDDVWAGLAAIATRWPQSPLFVVGFSLSGTILLNLLGLKAAELAALPQLRAALSVCAPLDLHASSAALSHWKNRHYDLYYTKTMLRRLLSQGIIEPSLVRQQLKRHSLRHLDEIITAPLGGYSSLNHYYDSCSPAAVAGNIRLPTTILSAADDPIVPADSVRDTPHSVQVKVLIEKSGGHLGFISRDGTRFGDRRWLDAWVVDWAEEKWLESLSREA